MSSIKNNKDPTEENDQQSDNIFLILGEVKFFV